MPTRILVRATTSAVASVVSSAGRPVVIVPSWKLVELPRAPTWFARWLPRVARPVPFSLRKSGTASVASDEYA